jgi:hypothetical protein
MSQDQADIPAYLRPTTCGTGDNAVTVYPLGVRTAVVFCRSAAALSEGEPLILPVSGGFPTEVGVSHLGCDRAPSCP